MELAGSVVKLRTVIEADRSALIAIRSTPEVRARWRSDDLEAEFTESLADTETQQLAIVTVVEGELVGLIQFSEEEDPEYRHANIDIYIDPAHHRRGYALDAITALVDHLVTARNHHRLTIDPAADNAAAISCYARAGFEPVGVMRQYERQADGTWVDGLLMELVV